MYHIEQLADNPVVIEDDPANTDSEDDLPSLEEVTRGLANREHNFDAELDGTKTNNQAEGLACTPASRAHKSDGQNLSKAMARVDDGAARKESYDDDPDTGDPPFSTQDKRKRPQSCDSYGFDSQMSDTSSERSLEVSHSAKRQKPSHLSRDGVVSNSPSTLKHACSVPPYDTALEVDNANGNDASNDNGDKGNQNIGHIISDDNVRNEDGDGDDCDDHDNRIYNKKLLESAVCLTLSPHQVSGNRRHIELPRKASALGGEDDGGESEERNGMHPPTAAMVHEPDCTDALPLEHQYSGSGAEHGAVDIDEVSSFSSDGEADNDDDEDSDFYKYESDQGNENDKEDNGSLRFAR